VEQELRQAKRVPETQCAPEPQHGTARARSVRVRASPSFGHSPHTHSAARAVPCCGSGAHCVSGTRFACRNSCSTTRFPHFKNTTCSFVIHNFLTTRFAMDPTQVHRPWWCAIHGTVIRCPFVWMNCEWTGEGVSEDGYNEATVGPDVDQGSLFDEG